MKKKPQKDLFKKYRHIIEILIGAMLFAVGGLVLWVTTIPTPDISSFAQRKVVQSTKIYDRTGETLLYDLNRDYQRKVIPFNDMSSYIKNATVAIEDAEFYQHNGVRISSIFRAVLANLGSGEFSQGGSTITQQVIKNTVLTGEKTIDRKLKEWVLALKLEQKYSKEEILESYLNGNPYGGTIYGIAEASYSYFRKEAKDLTLAESAYLAALPQAPSYYSPFGGHRDALEARKNLVLSRMKDLGFITEKEYEDAKDDEVVFEKPADGSLKAPHFVFYIEQYLEKKYGARALSEAGLIVKTTLDLPLQEKAEAIAQSYALENDKNYSAENASIVGIDPRTGEVVVMVGSRGYFDPEIDGNVNIATSPRQPGSTFKPFVYAAAFEKGYTRNTILWDVPIQFAPACNAFDRNNSAPCYAPNNYDGAFRGPMTITQALAQSINVPAVQALYLVGVENAISLAKKMGITTLTTGSQYGLSLVLGGGEVTLLDMTSAYGVFANKGIRHEPIVVLEVKDSKGNILESYKPENDNGTQVLEASVTNDISYILSNNDARTPVFGANSSLNIPGYDVAVKTGTTNDYRDAWIVGYTPNIVVGAWVGNNDNTPIDKKVAGYIVGPLWNAFMREVLKTKERTYFEEPTVIDPNLAPVLQGIPDSHSLLFSINKNNPLGPAPTNPSSDPQFKNWEAAVQAWLGVRN